MKILKVEIPKLKLCSVEEREQIFLLQFGNLLNELSVLHKLVHFTTNTDAHDRTVRAAQNSQAFLLLRILAGKLWEGWRLLERDLFKTKLSQEYVRNLSDLGTNSLDGLMKYFCGQNIIYRIRNEFSFHYSDKSSTKIKSAIKKVGDSEVFRIFISEIHCNCFYEASDVLTNLSIVEWTNASEYQAKLEKLLKEIIDITWLFLDFLGDCLAVFAKKHPEFKATEIDIPDPPDIVEVTLPYFIKGELEEKSVEKE